ncbi:uncharacterized protein BCR38DRAFT_332159 [Pseudomassariella vexata]|uniref:Uncharacterized protein n=1 Tax=Pseudomassariella vexata TaxID=1141098 RepID=A0A1Y2EF97_9PEZI|nr:uncharacterized protein BCR38DRAFT_332159 [Pseudomassariella vexata]ORY70240.1 hypothetical protein BCR38DRAFT_332159 [Pseudomassariella vexata]
MSRTTGLFTTLIRTHHIKSRKKLHRVKKAAAQCVVPFVLVRSGGSPGIMYAESHDETSLSNWVGIVHDLRYKDFQCVQKPAMREVTLPKTTVAAARFNEIESVAGFGDMMDKRGLGTWWKVGMGYQI